MAWKKDLAKLKQELVKEDPIPAKAPPPPKAPPKTPVSMSIEEEDAIFLSAMGLRPQQPRAAEAAPPQAQPAPPPLVRVEPKAEGPATGEFSSAMGDLKGMKSLRRDPVATKAAKPKAPMPPTAEPPPPPPVQAIVEVEAPAAAARIVPPAETKAEAPPTGAQEIHLAAGMAIEVDGGLDLRGHARTDGEERLKERILDGYNLGWRTLQVNLGPSPDLREMLLALIKSPEGRCVARYAQAPIPMGGAQAWILYFRALPPGPGENA